MALSNWDTYAVDETGQATNGTFVSKLGVAVSFYKNWLYVQDKRAWQDGGAYVEPTVMQITHGDLHYKDVKIAAVRGPKSGIYAAVYASEYQKQEEGQPYRPPVVRAMIGIGCYGFRGDGWVGVEQPEIDFLKAWVNHSETVPPHTVTGWSSDGGKPEVTLPGYTSYDFDEQIRAIPLDRGVRFNQGDAYFAERLGFEVPATEPGKSEPTVMSQIVADLGIEKKKP